MSAIYDEPPEERLFQAALAFAPEDREAFVREAAAGDSSLEAAVRLLLEGYAEAGGDEALATGGTARQRWAPSTEKPGGMIDHFRLIRVLGQGGMGTVWEAQQTAPVERRVALKVIKLGMDTEEVVKRFERERQTLALMQHPNIAQVHEAGITLRGRPYFVMELVPGEPITSYCERTGLSIRERLSLFLAVCSAIEHAHQKGIIHRDLKPSNLLVIDGMVKVIDFGVAKATRATEDGATLLTKRAQVLGTPAYMSPEQAISEGGDVDTRTDVYSLGVVLYELLTGRLPIDPGRLENSGVAEMQRILTEETPPRPSTRLERPMDAQTRETFFAVRGDLDWIVMKALAPERDRRYSGAAALAEDVERYLAGEAVSAVPPTLGYRGRKFVRRNKLVVGASSVIVLALTAGLGVSLVQMQRAREAQRETLLILADMQANNGARAAEEGEAAIAALWFAKAATTAPSDPERVETNRGRAEAWRQSMRHVVRAFDVGAAFPEELIWNPRYPALLTRSANPKRTQFWDLCGPSRRWHPELEEVRLAAWGPAGERVAVWNGSELEVRAYPSAAVEATLPLSAANQLAWSPDGDSLAIAGDGLLLWEWKTGKQVRVGGSDAVQGGAMDTSGTRLLLQFGERTEIRANRPPFALLHPAQRSSNSMTALFLGTGDHYAIADDEGSILVRETASGEEVECYPGRPGVNSHRPECWASGDGRFLVRQDQFLIDRERQVVLEGVPDHNATWESAAIQPHGGLFASGSYDRAVQLWSLSEGRRLDDVGAPHNAPRALAFSPDGRFLASAENGLVRVWRAELPAVTRNIAMEDEAISMAVISPDSRWLVPSGFTRQEASLRRTRAIGLHHQDASGPWLDPAGLLMSAAFDPEQRWLALAVSTTVDRRAEVFGEAKPGNPDAGGTGNIQLWNPEQGRRLGDPIAMPSEPRDVCVHPSGDWIGVVCANGEGVEIEVARRSSRVLFQQPEPLHRPQAIKNNGRCAYSPDGRLFAVWGDSKFAPIWDRQRERFLVPLPTEPQQMGAAFDLVLRDEVVVRTYLSRASEIRFVDPHTGLSAVDPLPYTNWPMLCRLDPGGQHLLLGGGDNLTQVWDWRRREAVGPAFVHEQAVLEGEFLPGGRRVVTSGYESRIHFWDYRSGHRDRPDLPMRGPTIRLELTPDGQTLVACGYYGGQIVLIDLAAAIPEPTLPPEGALALAEIDASAQVREGGGLTYDTPSQWLAKWRVFRERFPDFHGPLW